MFIRITFMTHSLPDFVDDGKGPHQPENPTVSSMARYRGLFIII